MASDDSSQEDVRSLSDGSISWRNSIEECDVIRAEAKESREESPTREAVILEEAPQEGLTRSSKKKSKKSKVSADRAIFEQE